MDETGGQISNVGQQVDGSSDAEESQRLVSCIFCNIIDKFVTTLLIIHRHKRYLHCHLLFNDLNILELCSGVQNMNIILYRKKMTIMNQKSEKRRRERSEKHVARTKRGRKRRKRKNPILAM